MARTDTMSQATRWGLGSLILVSTLLMAACSSGTSSGHPKALSSPGSSAAGSSVASSAGSSTSSAPASSSSVKAVAGGSSGSSFCGFARDEQAQETKDAAAFESDDPAQLEKFETKALAELPVFVSAAPGQLKPAVRIVVSADQNLFKALKAANFDISKVNPADMTALNTPAFQNATTQITDYLSKVCGIKPAD